MQKFLHPFEPIIDINSKFLILGTFPSLDSFKDSFYYANKRNQFWAILEIVFSTKLHDKYQKLGFLKKQNIALWDMIKSCKRKNSSDSNLKDITLHNIPYLLSQYPNINSIGFSGKKAYELYHNNFHLDIKTTLLPSPSPAYAKMKLSQKVGKYKEFFDKN